MLLSKLRHEGHARETEQRLDPLERLVAAITIHS